MRPLYERDSDLEVEAAIAAFLVERWKLSSARKMNPLAYGLDYALIRDEPRIVAFAEIKDRPKLPIGYGDGYYLALQKAVKARITMLPCFLVVQFKDQEIGCWQFKDALPGAIWAGRKDRGDPNDMEPHIVFPWGALSRLYG